ncbi:unnamed protein product [Arctia plantaginis]|uniref:Uncharacterized protein n=1 Tax=Arctia plantaginis TaxID=874455 RepID=A0A8S1BK75_ARCPL|nr:unnamed protein product [Arctia plantaginis]
MIWYTAVPHTMFSYLEHQHVSDVFYFCATIRYRKVLGQCAVSSEHSITGRRLQSSHVASDRCACACAETQSARGVPQINQCIREWIWSSQYKPPFMIHKTFYVYFMVSYKRNHVIPIEHR